MSADIEQLTSGVERVSLGHASREKPLRNESVGEDVEDKASPGDKPDFEMPDLASAIESPHGTGDLTEEENYSNPPDEVRNESYEYDPTTNSSETSPVHLRRSGKPSVGLGKDFCEVLYTVFASVAYLTISHKLSDSGTVSKVLRHIGTFNLVCVSLVQVIQIYTLLCDLFRLGLTNRAAGKITAPSKRGGASRVRSRGGRWNLSAVDKVDNCACKVLVLFSLIVTRICVILLCNFFLGFITVDFENLIEIGYENLNDMMSFGDSLLAYGGIFNSDLHANVLRECKTVPELVFENRYMCT